MKLPDLSPKVYSLSAVCVGYLLLDDMSANEQNALGNWLMLAAQVLCTNAYFKQLKSEEINNFNDNDTIKMMEKMIKALQIEIDNIKNSK